MKCKQQAMKGQAIRTETMVGWPAGRAMHLKICVRRPGSIGGVRIESRCHACSALSLYRELRVYEALQNDWLSLSLLDCSMCDMAANFTRDVPVQQDDTSRTNRPSPHISKVTIRITPRSYSAHSTYSVLQIRNTDEPATHSNTTDALWSTHYTLIYSVYLI
jgi:hypothetical protein